MTIEDFINELARIAPCYEWKRSDRVLLAKWPKRGKDKIYTAFEVVARARGFNEQHARKAHGICNWSGLLPLTDDDAREINKACIEPVGECSPTIKSHLFRAVGLL